MTFALKKGEGWKTIFSLIYFAPDYISARLFACMTDPDEKNCHKAGDAGEIFIQQFITFIKISEQVLAGNNREAPERPCQTIAARESQAVLTKTIFIRR